MILSAGKHAQKAFCGKRKRITLRTHIRSNVTVKAYGSCFTLLASLKIDQLTLELLRIVWKWKYPLLTIFLLGLCVNILLIILLFSIKVSYNFKTNRKETTTKNKDLPRSKSTYIEENIHFRFSAFHSHKYPTQPAAC